MTDDAPRNRPQHVLEDPSAKAVARVYSKAFLNAAQPVGVDNALEEFTSFVDDVLNTNPQFADLLTGQLVSRDDKLGIIDRVVAPHGSQLFTNFLRVLARHERLDLLPLILGETWLAHETQAGRQRVTIRTAAPLDDAKLAHIQQRLASALSIEPILIPEVDASLLGGLVVQIGDTVHDGSLRTRIGNLSQRLRERYLHEIQSGRDRFSSPEGN